MKIKFTFLLFVTLLCINAFAYDFSAVCESGQTLFFNITSDSEPYTVEVTYENVLSDENMSPYYTIPITGNLVIPESVTSNGITYSVTRIGLHAFSSCNELISVTIPYSVTVIDAMAFNQNLSSIYYTGDIAGWCRIRFYNQPLDYAHNLYINNELVTDLVIPETVEQIKDYAFSGATCLTSVTIPTSVDSIGINVFGNCTGLTSVYYTGDVAGWCDILFTSQYSNPLSYAHNLYINNELATNLIIPETVTEIKDYAFSDANSLTSVTIPNSVERIGYRAFLNCEGLASVTIGSSVIDIVNYAFSGCISMTSIDIPNSVTNIGDFAFSGCSGLLSVSIGISVTNIGNFAFKNCSSLSDTIIIPNSVETIGGGAFANCSNIESVIIGSSVMTIGNSAFENCSNISGVITIPSSVMVIGSKSFDNCTNLSTVTLGNSVASIGDYAFRNCSSLSNSITFPNSVGTIGMGAFVNCSSISSIIIGNSVTNIGNSAFRGCVEMDSIICLVENPPVISQQTFYNINADIPIIVPCGSVSAYNEAEYWSDFSNIHDNCTGVEEVGFADIQIYPNPVDNTLNIISSETIFEIDIVNVMGQIVYRTEVNAENAVCEVEGLVNGMYVVRIRHFDKLSVRKFIKE